MEYKYQGIILNKIDVGETDRLYIVYTLEAGRLMAKAIGVKKPNAKLAGNLEPLTYSEIFLAKGRGQGNITGAIAIENFLEIKKNIEILEKVFEVIKIFSRLITQEEKDEEIFNLLLKYLSAMEREAGKPKGSDSKIDILTLGFVFKLLKKMGYAIETRKCNICGNKLVSGENYFSAQLGGIICPACIITRQDKVRITDEAVKFIRIFLDNKIENLSKIKAEKENLNNLKIIANEAVRWIAS